MAKPVLTIAVFNEATGWRLPDALVDVVSRAAAEDAEVRGVGTRAELADALPTTDFLAGLALTEDQLATHGSRVRWVHLTGTLGDEEPLLIGMLRSGVRVTTAASVRAISMSEHAMALSLSLMRRLDASIQAQTDQRWLGTEVVKSVRSLAGSTVCVIADGSIARELARRLAPFGVRIIVVQPHGGEEIDGLADDHISIGRLKDAIKVADLTIIACARTETTQALLGRDEIADMKKGAMLVDVSRGGIISNSAIVEALRKQHLGGAGLDVFETEPLAPNSPLWSMNNVIITPHVASASPRYWERTAEALGSNLRRILADQRLMDEVNLGWYKQR